MQQAHAFRLAVVAPSGRSHPARAPCAHRFATRRRNLLCRAVVGGDSDTKPTDAVKVEVDSLKKKVSLLDAVLGTQDEPAKTPAAPLAAVKADEASTSTSKVEISSDLWAQMKAADAARDGAKKDTSSSTDAEMGKILDSMKKIGDKQGLTPEEQEKMRKEFENLLSTIATTPIIPNEDVAKMKEQVFSKSTFWVTGTETVLDYPGAILFKGNLRGKTREVYLGIRASMAAAFGDKYEVMIVDEPRMGRPDTAGDKEVKPSFVVMNSALARPRPVAGWQYGAALVLALVSALSSVEVGLETQVALLPKETLEFFANPNNLDNLPPGAIIPGFDKFDPLTFVEHALPVAFGIGLCAAAHEAGHRIVAAQKKVDLGPSFFIPNGDVGTFGAVTQIKSLLQGREDLFDIAVAGPLAGGAVALGLFGFGLAASAGGGGVEAGLLPVPGALFNGSLLLGGISSAVLGSGKQVLVHPALVAGWCGLVTSAFNLLPMGRTDGGRMAMAAYGRRSLSLTSLLSYLGLAIGILGGELALNWGLYVLIVQRDPEPAPLDDVTAVDEKRSTLAGGLIALSLAILLPLGSP